MATDRLGLYNIALATIGERSLDSLSEDGEPRHELDAVWARGGGLLRFLLEQGRWHWALRSQALDPSVTVTPSFGFTYAYELPVDYVTLDMISPDERFGWPLVHYEIESGYVFCDANPLYIRYISDDDDFGGDYAQWPETFVQWAGTWMATQIAPRIAATIDVKNLIDLAHRYLTDARSKNAVQSPTRFPPAGAWASSRQSRLSHNDRGKRGRLIG